MIARRIAIALGLVLAARSARAGHCDNPCDVADRDVCIGFFDDGGKLIGDQIAARGRPLELRVGRQSGTCGGLKPLAPSEVAITIDAGAGESPLALDGDATRLRWTPAAAGEYRVTAHARDGGGLPDRRLVLITDGPRSDVRLRVTPPAGSGSGDVELTLRRAPRDVDAAAAAGFAPRGWPIVFRGAGKPGAPVALALPEGDYQLEWRRGVHLGLARVAMRGAGPSPIGARGAGPSPIGARGAGPFALDVRGAAGALALALATPALGPLEWLLVRARAADGALLYMCLTAPLTLHLAPGDAALAQFRSADAPGRTLCFDRPPGWEPRDRQTVTIGASGIKPLGPR